MKGIFMGTVTAVIVCVMVFSVQQQAEQKMWIAAGYLDFVCPMDYTVDNDQFWNLVANQLDILADNTPVYPGIGASSPGLPPEQVARQIYIASGPGVSGFIIFNYDLSVATELLPALSKGLTDSESQRRSNTQ